MADSRRRRALPAAGVARRRRRNISDDPGLVRRCVALWLDMVLMGIVVSIGGMAVRCIALVIGFDDFSSVNDTWLPLINTGAFLAIEGVVPWLNGGQTPGGWFVHIDLRNTQAGAFAQIRLLSGAACHDRLHARYFPPIALVLLVFYAFKKKMPHDCI